MRAEVERMTEAHRRTLDQLATAVASFAADQRLAFYNAAYRVAVGTRRRRSSIQNPTDSAVLDRLRAARKLPEQAGLPRMEERAARGLSRARGARARVASARRAHLARRHHAQSARRRHLSVRGRHRAARPGAALRGADPRAGRDARQPRRGVAVFGSDGRLACTIRRSRSMWRLSAAALNGSEQGIIRTSRPCSAGAARCTPTTRSGRKLRGAVTGDRTARTDRGAAGAARRQQCSIARPCRCPTAPRWSTFQDVTDTVNVERALTERNDALEDADRLKSRFRAARLIRVALAAHQHHRLRAPAARSAYRADHRADSTKSSATTSATSTNRRPTRCSRSSTTSSISPPSMPARCRSISARSISATMRRRRRGLQRPPGQGGDPARHARHARHRQLRRRRAARAAGAVQPAVQRGRLLAAADRARSRCERRDDAVVFTVTDRGPGHPAGHAATGCSTGSRPIRSAREHRGAGLGLSIVRSFVELHGGTVTLDSAVGRGTTVTCVFPIRHADREAAA